MITPAQKVFLGGFQIKTVHAEDTLVYLYDIEDPVISALNLSSDNQSSPQWVTLDEFIVKGTATDKESGIKSVTVNGIAANVVGSKFECPVSVPTTNVTKITIIAKDFLDHTTEIVRYVRKDKTAPVIEFDSWGLGRGTQASPFFTVKTSQVVTGRVTDDVSGVKSLTVNGNTIPVGNDGRFSININLPAGLTQSLTIHARDNAGNLSDASMYAYADTSVKKLLQIYPGVGAGQLQQWLVNDGYGQGVISVSQCSQAQFNSNPYGYLGSNGNWNYDVIFFGSWDCNNGADLNSTAAAAVRAFANAGRGVIVGHDTMRSVMPGFASIRDLFNLKIGGGLDDSANWGPWSATVEITKTSFFTTYPNYIGGVGTKLNIPTAHVSAQVCKKDEELLKFVGPYSSNYGEPPAHLQNAGYVGDFYLMCHGNCAMIQTGHSSGAATADERKIIANLVIYLALKLKTKLVTGEMLE